jgi:hypothetical protein
MASAPLPPLSASVTRILALTGFSSELKTKDIQAAFSEYESMNGGFKIKWVDDTSLLLVFNDAGVAKRAYLQTILSPPASLAPSTGPYNIRIKPYDGADAQAVIYTVNNRRNNTRGSISVSSAGHARGVSVGGVAQGHLNGTGGNRMAWKNAANGNGLAASIHAPNGGADSDGGSPTIPNLPAQPTLNSMINSSIQDVVGTVAKDSPTSVESAAGHFTSPLRSVPAGATESTPPRMGDSARRMVGAALGLKHPALSSRRGVEPSESLNKAMGGMVIAE